MASSSSTSTHSPFSVKDGAGRIRAGIVLLPLRLFLGVTFLYAGIQKLANPRFLDGTSPTSLHSQLVGATHTSPIGSLLGHLVSVSTGLGVLIALGELAIGIGALLGFLTRIAAVGGMVLSFSLFLAISYHTSPYYSGSDIVFFFAWTPLVLAGAAGAPAVDTWLAEQAAAAPSSASDGLSRRVLVSTGIVAAGTAILAGTAAVIGRAAGGTTTASGGGSSTTSTTATTSGPSTTGGGGSTTTTTATKGTAIGPSSQVPVGGSASFTLPSSGDPGLVIQPTSDTFVAFDAVCPHAGCTVSYQASAQNITCPCHGSLFDAKTGAVLQGPATSGLVKVKVIKGANGDLYVV